MWRVGRENIVLQLIERIVVRYNNQLAYIEIIDDSSTIEPNLANQRANLRLPRPSSALYVSSPILRLPVIRTT